EREGGAGPPPDPPVGAAGACVPVRDPGRPRPLSGPGRLRLAGGAVRPRVRGRRVPLAPAVGTRRAAFAGRRRHRVADRTGRPGRLPSFGGPPPGPSGRRARPGGGRLTHRGVRPVAPGGYGRP